MRAENTPTRLCCSLAYQVRKSFAAFRCGASLKMPAVTVNSGVGSSSENADSIGAPMRLTSAADEVPSGVALHGRTIGFADPRGGAMGCLAAVPASRTHGP